MRKLPLIIGLVFLLFQTWAQQNPHGETLTFTCTDCHTTEGWTFSKEAAIFNHDSTQFVLEGEHRFTDCAACHTSLVFSEAKTNCVDCHTDMHNNTVGTDCAQCHNSNSWIVSNISEIHQLSRFPLLGAHNTADCSACHKS
ncbi:MAG: cytochrome c3 family protein, partial [Prolixibacteraceae bacterium]|nr:cytochrome c3 family protein [Prolixibacteraceae bacterium]